MINKKLTRRGFLAVGGLGAIGLMLGSAKFYLDDTAYEMLVYIGNYAKKAEDGIHVYKLDLKSGKLSYQQIVKGVLEPSFLTLDKNKKCLYAVNEIEEYDDKKSGSVSAFEIDQKTGNLQPLNVQSSLGGNPCNITISENGKFVLTANYIGGNVVVFKVDSNGSLGAAADLVQHSGSGPNEDRQKSAHPHSVVLDRNNRFAFVPDLGIDKLVIYRFDADNGKLTVNQIQPFFQTKAGAGPRHFKFHPNGKLAFLINELDSTIVSLAYNEQNGTLKEVQTVSTLPETFSASQNGCAEVEVSPNGKFLYGSNRGHDSIVSYKIDESTGKLEYIEHISTQGKSPRNFAIDPTGKLLLAANQNSNSVYTFFIDENSGKLQPTGNYISVPKPVCLKLIPKFT